ncbi:MAG: flagellar protein FliT [Lachnospiraceae bacterium]|jgi:uncharacterized membrane protein YcgQ (UPF0703/DUF1980 family)|nr:flagellar protein FliT [Lachnospiraceae bacterium]
MSQNIAQILLQSLNKKNQILDDIIRENEQQEQILKQDTLDMDALEASLDRIGEFVEMLERLDDGFEALYDKVRTEVVGNKAGYRTEIAQMQNYIQQITDKVVKINAARMRNQMRADSQFKKQAQEIKNAMSKTKVSQNYYNSMNKLNYVAPQFYDNKK